MVRSALAAAATEKSELEQCEVEALVRSGQLPFSEKRDFLESEQFESGKQRTKIFRLASR